MLDLSMGLSGCSVSRLPNGNVKKSSASLAYNDRFSRQIAKQTAFSKLTFRNLCAPLVVTSYFENGLLVCNREYCSGLSYHEYLSTASHKQIDEVIAGLFEYFDALATDCKHYPHEVPQKLIKDKLTSLAAKSQFPSLIDDLLNRVSKANNQLPHTFCHGDLTLSNIIFHPKKLYLIDFLDSFVDSYLIDLVKLKQDLIWNWSATVQRKDSLRLAQARETIWRNLEKRYCADTDSDYFRILEAMNFLRIEPYVTNPSQVSFLNSIINSFS